MIRSHCGAYNVGYMNTESGRYYGVLWLCSFFKSKIETPHRNLELFQVGQYTLLTGNGKFNVNFHPSSSRVLH